MPIFQYVDLIGDFHASEIFEFCTFGFDSLKQVLMIEPKASSLLLRFSFLLTFVSREHRTDELRYHRLAGP